MHSYLTAFHNMFSIWTNNYILLHMSVVLSRFLRSSDGHSGDPPVVQPLIVNVVHQPPLVWISFVAVVEKEGTTLLLKAQVVETTEGDPLPFLENAIVFNRDQKRGVFKV